MKDPQVVLSKLERIRAETLRRLDGLAQGHLDWRPAPGSDDEEA